MYSLKESIQTTNFRKQIYLYEVKDSVIQRQQINII